MDPDELSNWLRLLLTPGLGASSAQRLLGAFGLPSQIWGQPREAIAQVVTPPQAQALGQAPAELDRHLDACMHWLAHGGFGHAPRRIVSLGDAAYPAALLQLPDPPLLLFLTGRLDLPLNEALAIAIVGSRNPTPQGALTARQFARDLALSGWCIVSGLALGVDGAAHEGALDSGEARRPAPRTVAVVGTGLDRVYPARHRDLAHRIAGDGLLISEFLPGTPALASNFPRRNRLIAALSRATLVVEAALQSGSLITARLAADLGKDVLAIPGSIHSPQSRGCHALIRQGAKLVESTQDILDEFPGVSGAGVSALPVPPVDNDDPVMTALGHDPVGLDALQARTGLLAGALLARLTTLEVEGRVARLPGGLFQRLSPS